MFPIVNKVVIVVADAAGNVFNFVNFAWVVAFYAVWVYVVVAVDCIQKLYKESMDINLFCMESLRME